MLFLLNFSLFIILFINSDLFCGCTWEISLQRYKGPDKYDNTVDDSLVEEYINTWLLYIDKSIYEMLEYPKKIKNKTNKIHLLKKKKNNSNVIHLLKTKENITDIIIYYVNFFIRRLEKSKEFIKRYFPRSLYSYINPNGLKTRIIFFKVLCNKLKISNEKLKNLPFNDLHPNKLFIKKAYKIDYFLKELRCELDKILMYTFITTSRNADENRKIHCPKSEIAYSFLCVICNKYINFNNCIFAFLCGHQAHANCWKKKNIMADKCLKCGKLFWDGIEYCDD